jgi:hypothetical protein
MLSGVNQEPLAFCMQHCAYKKHEIDVKECQSGAPYFFVCIGSLTVRAIGSKPVVSIGNAY